MAIRRGRDKHRRTRSAVSGDVRPQRHRGSGGQLRYRARRKDSVKDLAQGEYPGPSAGLWGRQMRFSMQTCSASDKPVWYSLLTLVLYRAAASKPLFGRFLLDNGSAVLPFGGAGALARLARPSPDRARPRSEFATSTRLPTRLASRPLPSSGSVLPILGCLVCQGWSRYMPGCS